MGAKGYNNVDGFVVSEKCPYSFAQIDFLLKCLAASKRRGEYVIKSKSYCYDNLRNSPAFTVVIIIGAV